MIEVLNDLITIPFLAPFLVFITGVLMAFSPCCLSTIPLVIGYVNEDKMNFKRSLLLSSIFAFGSAITFTSLGVIAVLFGSFINFSSGIFLIIMGLLMIAMGLQIMEVINVINIPNLFKYNKKRGKFGAFLMGLISGFFSSPCSTPVLIIILSLVATTNNLLYGTLLLFMYALGHSVLIIIAGTSVGFVSSVKKSKNYQKFNKAINYLLGIIALLIGFYLFYIGV